MSQLLTVRQAAERLACCPRMVRRSFDKARSSLGLAVRFHDLRHTYASWLVQAGVGLSAVQLLMGHSTPAITARYAHLDPGHLREAVEKMRARLNK